MAKSPPTDAELLKRARRDAQAFRELYERYAAAVHAFFVRRTHDQDAALELTAETFAAAWLARTRFEDRAEGSAAPWLFGIARNLLRQYYNRKRVETAGRALMVMPILPYAAFD